MYCIFHNNHLISIKYTIQLYIILCLFIFKIFVAIKGYNDISINSHISLTKYFAININTLKALHTCSN